MSYRSWRFLEFLKVHSKLKIVALVNSQDRQFKIGCPEADSHQELLRVGSDLYQGRL